VTSLTFKYINRFEIRVRSALAANQALLSTGNGTALSAPPPIAVRLLNSLVSAIRSERT
jgi:hypothetical protein